MIRVASGFAAALSLLVLLASARADNTVCVTLGAGGVLGTADSTNLRPSANGHVVAFDSKSTNLLPGLVNAGHVFVRDLDAGTLELASVSSAGAKGNAPSKCDGLSSDGRFVVFESLASNLVPGDFVGLQDIFVRDRLLGTTTRASLTAAGGDPDAWCEDASISDDGRYVMFETSADNMVPQAGQTSLEVYVRDMQTGQTQLASALASGAASGFSESGAISGDGRYVVFASAAAGFVNAQLPGYEQVYRRELATGAIELVSGTAAGAYANGSCDMPEVSRDGRFVAFRSAANNLAPGDSGITFDIFLRDMLTGVTERISTTPFGKPPSADALFPILGRTLSDDGRFVVYSSFATNIVFGLTGNVARVYLCDRVAGTTAFVGMTPPGGSPDNNCFEPTMSADGLRVFFQSKATNLAGPDTNASYDGFLRTIDTEAWHDLGFALAGVAGLPVLTGTGSLEPMSLDSLGLQHAAPSAPCVWFVSLDATPTPFKGGTLVPVPSVLEAFLPTGPAGDVSLSFNWPPGFPTWTEFRVQAAIVDAAAPQGVALSNALIGVTP
jgi:Tol biopolymer transport system component